MKVKNLGRVQILAALILPSKHDDLALVNLAALQSRWRLRRGQWQRQTQAPCAPASAPASGHWGSDDEDDYADALQEPQAGSRAAVDGDVTDDESGVAGARGRSPGRTRRAGYAFHHLVKAAARRDAVAAGRREARSLSLGARRAAVPPRGCLRSASPRPQSRRVVHFELDGEGRVEEQETSKRFAVSSPASSLASSLPPPSLPSVLSPSPPCVAASGLEPRSEPSFSGMSPDMSPDDPPIVNPSSGNAQAGVGQGEGVASAGDDASVSSSVASHEYLCWRCLTRLEPGEEGGFGGPAGDSPYCGFCFKIKDLRIKDRRHPREREESSRGY